MHRAIREMRAEQKKSNLVIPMAPFVRLVHSLGNKYVHEIRFKKSALHALQVDAESYLIDLLHQANNVAVWGGRQTLTVHDIRAVQKLRTRTII